MTKDAQVWHMGSSTVVDRDERGQESSGQPAGGPYEWFRRAQDLLASGNPEAALLLVERVREQEPESVSVQEIRARALFDAGRYQQSAEAFESILERAPDDDYAHFGLGMCLWRRLEFVRARDELAMAFVMRPGRSQYAQALAQVKATIHARVVEGLPLEGPVRLGGLG